MPPKKEDSYLCANELIQMKIDAPAELVVKVKCTHGSFAIICLQCKAEQEAVDMFLI